MLFVFAMAPFVVFVAAGLATSKSADAHELIEIKSSFSSIDWSTLLSVLYWNFSGFDCVSTISGEIKDPSRTVFRGSMLGCVMMIVVYALCLSTAVLVNDPNWRDFEEGSFVDVAKTIETRVGSHQGWLVNWLAVASLFSFIYYSFASPTSLRTSLVSLTPLECYEILEPQRSNTGTSSRERYVHKRSNRSRWTQRKMLWTVLTLRRGRRVCEHSMSISIAMCI